MRCHTQRGQLHNDILREREGLPGVPLSSCVPDHFSGAMSLPHVVPSCLTGSSSHCTFLSRCAVCLPVCGCLNSVWLPGFLCKISTRRAQGLAHSKQRSSLLLVRRPLVFAPDSSWVRFSNGCMVGCDKCDGGCSDPLAHCSHSRAMPAAAVSQLGHW